MFSKNLILWPVRQWAAIVRRIWGYSGASAETPVSAIWRHDRIEHITSAEMMNDLRAAVVLIGEEVIGIKAEEVGTHSIRSGAAMAMSTPS